ncbi:hypothetical protein [Plantactinospora sp. CA-290183]|uniref:hypothetical protein n=1 Tax=Plantactinospora sp. CA-290183 TaxID=3240006 RepID=UPI003D91F6B8
MRRFSPVLAAIAAGALLTACGGDPRPSPSSASPSTASAPAAPAATQSTGPAVESPLTREQREAFRAAMARYPGADLDRCTRKTPLTDRACGAAITAANRVAADTVRRLRARNPEHFDLLYGGLSTMTAEMRADLTRLGESIPCYGLSDAAPPPAPLRAEAQSICAEGADIFKVRWRIFRTQVDP